ncbi:25378_t:CDS:2 [Gigaspora rosea]|nr:25378_t:CDS:2 [Gigaspora rosea]
MFKPNTQPKDAKILEDWETWMQQKTAILVRRSVRNTNLNLTSKTDTARVFQAKMVGMEHSGSQKRSRKQTDEFKKYVYQFTEDVCDRTTIPYLVRKSFITFDSYRHEVLSDLKQQQELKTNPLIMKEHIQ